MAAFDALLVVASLLLILIIITPRPHRATLAASLAGAVFLVWTGPHTATPPSPPPPPDAADLLLPPRALLQPSWHLAQRHILGDDGRDNASTNSHGRLSTVGRDWLSTCGHDMSTKVDLYEAVEKGGVGLRTIIVNGYSDAVGDMLHSRPDHWIQPNAAWPEDFLDGLRKGLRDDCHNTASWKRPLQCWWYRRFQLPSILSEAQHYLDRAHDRLHSDIHHYYTSLRESTAKDMAYLKDFRTRLSTDIADIGHSGNFARHRGLRVDGAIHTIETYRALYLLSLLHSARLSALLNFVDDLYSHFLEPFTHTVQRARAEITNMLDNAGPTDKFLDSVQRLVDLEFYHGYFSAASSRFDTAPLVIPQRLQDKYMIEWLTQFWIEQPLTTTLWDFPPPPPSLLFRLRRYLDDSAALDFAHPYTAAWWQAYWHGAPVHLDDARIWCKSVTTGWQENTRIVEPSTSE